MYKAVSMIVNQVEVLHIASGQMYHWRIKGSAQGVLKQIPKRINRGKDSISF